MEEERKEELTEREQITEEAPESSSPVGEIEGESAEKGNTPERRSKFNKTHAIRLTVSIVASAVTLTFFGLSYYYFQMVAAAIIFAATITVVALAFMAIYKEWETVYKLAVTTLYVAAIFLIGFFILKRSGVLANVHSVEDFTEFVNNSGGVAEIIFVVANFLQVTIVPIPSSITTTAGAILFDGIWKPLYLTVIGLVAGSMFAFFLGRVLGVRFANWLVGEKAIRKYKEMTKGRDKIVLFYMFIFPFFPDDFLCILAGLTDYSYLGFFLLQILSRTLGTLVTILVTKGIISIPLEGWWLVLWGVIIVAVIVLLILTIKYSDKIERALIKLIDKLTFGIGAKKKKNEEEVEENLSTLSLGEENTIEATAAEGGDPPPPPNVESQGEQDEKH